MSFIQRAQAAVEAAQSAPQPVNLTIMLGSLIISFLQPVAIIITVLWGCLQIHGYVKREFGRDFLWMSRLFNKGK
jgi:hypothetical protein